MTLLKFTLSVALVLVISIMTVPLRGIRSELRIAQIQPDTRAHPTFLRVEENVEAQSRPTCSATDRVHSLPKQLQDVKTSLVNWVNIEWALMEEPSRVLPSLLDRYSAEQDPVYKGLLAVLLATDFSTHSLILQDFLREGDRELFADIALFALLKDSSLTPNTILSDSNQEAWHRIIRLLTRRSHELRIKRGETAIALPKESDDALYLYSHPEMPLEIAVASQVGVARSSAAREALLWSLDHERQWKWIGNCARISAQYTANSNSEFAKVLIEKYLRANDATTASKGLDLLDEAQIPADYVRPVAEIARGAGDDGWLFDRAVGLLGQQRSVECRDLLFELYALNCQRMERAVSTMRAMRVHGHSSFEQVARLEVVSKAPDVRVEALTLLSAVNPEASIEALIQGLSRDPERKVRAVALAELARLARWSPPEESALEIAANNDPDPQMRRLAMRVKTAEYRRTCYWTTSFMIFDESEGSEQQQPTH